ncbi:MAG TPA: GLPGLI family protein [Mucilaginibacter sp.]|nr:GLPGLI family protein [Mucilaginibacter sp.]
MKKPFLFYCLLLSVIAVKAQKPETAQVLVHYKFSHLRDTTKREDIYNEAMVLFLGPNASAYKSYDRQLQEALLKKQLQEQMAEHPGNINIQRKSMGTNTEYYQFAGTKKLVRKERLINSYLIEEPMPAIDWNIGSDTASFAGLHCQKATGHFKGRDYTAWFCPDLPYHNGPWKLNGLPGVILEAYDAKKDVVFKFDGIEDLSKMPKAAPVAVNNTPQSADGRKVMIFGMEDANADPNIIQLPANAIKTNEKEFAALREAMRKDPNAFVQSAMAGQGMNVQTGPKPVMKIQVAQGPTINNPIELPEKK